MNKGNTCRRVGWIAFGLCLVVAISGCNERPEDQRGTRVGSVGLVSMDGEPLPMGRVLIISDSGNGKLKASAMIEEGVFVFDENNGPLEGAARVEIHPLEMELEEFEAQRKNGKPQTGFTRLKIPARYNISSTLTAEVSKEGGIVPSSFELTSDN